MRQRDYAGAVTVYSSLLFRFNDRLSSTVQAEVRGALGIALLRAKDTAEGVKQLEIATKLDTTDARLVYKLALGLSRLKKNDEAVTHFRQALAMKPTEAEYAWRLGMELIRCRQKDEGIQYLHEAIRINPQHAGAIAELNKRQLME